MPNNKKQGIIFGIIMSYAMAYGMEIYNIAIKEGVNLTAGGFSNMTNFLEHVRGSSIYPLDLRQAVFTELIPFRREKCRNYNYINKLMININLILNIVNFHVMIKSQK